MAPFPGYPGVFGSTQKTSDDGDSILDGPLNLPLKFIALPLINEKISAFGTATGLFFKEKVLHLTLLLKGLEDRPVTVACTKFTIAQDGSTITPEEFTADMPFVEGFLNEFWKRPIEVPEGKLRWALSLFA